MKLCGIYKITSPTGKIYIGQSIDILRRQYVYSTLNCKKQSKLYSSLLSHGWNKHKFEILCQCDKKELDTLEIFYIELYQSFNTTNGLNLKTGGHFRIQYTDEIRKTMSDKNKGKSSWAKGVKFTKNHRRNLSKAKLGKVGNKKGKIVSKQTKIKISLNRPLRKLTPETIKNIKKELTNGAKQYALSKKYNVNQSQISRINNNKAHTTLWQE